MTRHDQLQQAYADDIAAHEAAYEDLMQLEVRMHEERMKAYARMRSDALNRLAEQYGMVDTDVKKASN